ncbi:MAG: FAD-dependent oxidoreductase [Vicinamibacteria bacterium]
MSKVDKIGAAGRPTVWTETAKMKTYAPLAKSIQTNVCIVGGGIAGLTTAYLLLRAGKSVVVIEDGDLAGGATCATTAHLSNAIDARYQTIERLHGRDGSRLTAESHTAAISEIEAIVKREKIDCDFQRVDGFLFLPPDQKADLLDRELEAAHRAGLVDVERVERAPIDGFNTGPSLRFPRQAQFHPLKYLAGVAKAIEGRGGQIFTNTHAESIEGGMPAKVTAGSHVVNADFVVVATNTPVNDLVVMHTKQAPYMSYVIGAALNDDSMKPALLWDTAEPYHYVRLQRVVDKDGDRTVLIVGGEDHKTGQAEDVDERYARLERWAKDRFPHMGDVEFHWAGQVMESMDGLAFIGRNPLDKDNVFIVTGDSGMGMTHGTIAGLLLTDLITGKENPWSKLYDPARKTLLAGPTFLKESANIAVQYADWITAGDVATTDEIPRGSGAVVRRGLTKRAVYCDDHGKLHERSAICPHLGCIVGWNPGEKTWDCPCHGSRFDKMGKVLNGPANRDLAE